MLYNEKTDMSLTYCLMHDTKTEADIMLNDYWKQLKSGTDVRGVAVAVENGLPVNLTDEAVKKITAGFIMWLLGKNGGNASSLRIAVGHDCRISGDEISDCVTDTLVKSGCRVYNCGLSSTPAMFMATLDLKCDGAIQITASHHPYDRNGLKFFTPKGGIDSGDLVSVLQLAQDGINPVFTGGGICEEIDYMSRYAKGLRDMICKEVNAEVYDKPLNGFKIAVDAGNGVGGFYAYDVLEPLGADISGSCFLEPDGTFPNHIPNPENKTAIDAISEAVVASKSDMGVIFDTDVDRGAAVDGDGKEINRNRLVAIAAAIALEGNEGGTIVTDSITSSGLKSFIEDELGGKHHRFKRGYKNVINEAQRLNAEGINCPLAIETSGHAAMRENYFLDDGAYLVTKIIIKAAKLRKEGKSLGSLIEKLREPVESTEIRLPIHQHDFREYGDNVINALFEYARSQPDWHIAEDNHEGIRVSFDKQNGDGWFLLRLSVHDPIMPLNIESDSEGGADVIKNKLRPFLEKYFTENI